MVVYHSLIFFHIIWTLEWRQFALRKNIFDVTVGLMVATALTNITISLSTDIFMPLIISSWSGSNIQVCDFNVTTCWVWIEYICAFGTVACSCWPPIIPPSLALSIKDMYVVLSEGKRKCSNCYKTLDEAAEDGAVSTLRLLLLCDVITQYLNILNRSLWTTGNFLTRWCHLFSPPCFCSSSTKLCWDWRRKSRQKWRRVRGPRLIPVAQQCNALKV